MSKETQSIWVHITSGRGPDECALAVRKLFEHLSNKASAVHLTIEIVDSTAGKMPDTYDSMLLNVSGHRADTFIKPYVGSVKWASKSPYRPKHKRKNWFVGVGIMAPLSTLETHVKPADITWKAVKASGPGGQHVNTTDSAVQATHHPSGIQVRSSEGRSQHANKKNAVEKIVMALQAREKTAQANSAQSQWATHSDLERGNPVKTFVGKAFRER